jgi:hypothetical protein
MAIRDIVQAAAGAGEDKLYVDDVFSTYLYTGNSSTQTINNGIDLDGKGGLIWGKVRNSVDNNWLIDTARGASKVLASNLNAAQTTPGPPDWVSFNNNGFSIGASNGEINQSSQTYVSWTLRKSPKYFDIVTYTGNGSTQNISHSLDTQPGCVMIKKTSGAGDWMIWHRGLSAGHYIRFTTAAQNNSFNDAYFGNSTTYVDPTSTQFTVGYGDLVNSNGATFVAYVFAHDAGGFGDDGEQDVISCGSFTTDGSGNAIVNLGYEPQWVLVKPASTAGQWRLFDTMRGFSHSSAAMLLPNLANAEGVNTTAERYFPTATGFNLTPYDAGGVTSMYMAIRRPMKTPEAGTEVFAMDTQGGSSGKPNFKSGFPVDFAFVAETGGSARLNSSRLTSPKIMYFNNTNAESSDAERTFDYQNGWGNSTDVDSTRYSWMFKRAPAFMDVVAFTQVGTGSVQTINHNLTVVPELIIFKTRGGGDNWRVRVGSYSGGGILNSNSGFSSSLYATNLTSTTFGFNQSTAGYNSGMTFVSYLFATLAGVSCVSSYSGTGGNVNVDCGFSGGARFILIKRTDSTGDWYLWDSARGIVAGNDPYLLLNTTAAQVTNTDYIDPLASGFTVTSSAPAALNASGGSYIFLAIA